MTRYIALRIAKGLLTFLIAVTITFLIVRLMPGDPTTALISDSLSPDDARALKESFGLDKPLYQQYFLFLRNLSRGDLGYSFFYKDSVMSIIGNKLWWTLLLMSTALGITLLIGVPLGVISAKRQGGIIDQVINVAVVIGVSIFVPLLAFLLLYFFSFKLMLTPIGGAYTPGIDKSALFLDVVRHMVLPCLTLVITYLASIVLYTRNSMLDALKEDYVRTAKAKGVSDKIVTWSHALRNALIPTVTVTGLMIGKMVAGAVLTETVFSWPGVGTMIYDAVQKQDFPLLQGAFLVLAASVVIMTLITDLVVAWLDPRIKL
jgi:peptide/nickel transport system permease protein